MNAQEVDVQKDDHQSRSGATLDLQEGPDTTSFSFAYCVRATFHPSLAR